MADPVSATLLAVSIGATVAGGVTTAIGQSYQSKAQSNQFKYQQGVAELNRQISEQNAAYARSVGEVEAQKSGMRSRFQLGGIKVAKAAGNIDVNTGSAKQVQDSQEEIGRHDQSVIRANAARQAYGYEVEAVNQKAQGGLYGAAADNALTAGNFAVAGTLLSTAGAVATKWYGGQAAFGGGGGGGTGYNATGGAAAP